MCNPLAAFVAVVQLMCNRPTRRRSKRSHARHFFVRAELYWGKSKVLTVWNFHIILVPESGLKECSFGRNKASGLHHSSCLKRKDATLTFSDHNASTSGCISNAAVCTEALRALWQHASGGFEQFGPKG